MTVREQTLDSTGFGAVARILHWLMAVSIMAMMFVGAAMVGYIGEYNRLLTIHKTLGVAILILAVIRIGNRILHRPPQQIDTMSRPERFVANGSEILMYALFFLQPVVGWALVSASGIPIHILGGLRIPPIAPIDADLYATLRTVHSILAYTLLASFTAHICAVLIHALVVRDKLLRRMTFTIPRR